MLKKITLIVLDSVGIGALPDASQYGDDGSNTLVNLANYFEDGLNLPNLQQLGLANIANIKGIPPISSPTGNFGKCAELSKGKDTTTGHWEIAGVIKDTPFPLYPDPDGFPDEVIKPFIERTGTEILWNKTASGTEIIQRLGDEHVKTGKLIVYTSADSVFQIAAHEELYPPERLYEICQIARDILVGKHGVARVIARPFIGTSGNYIRTINRRDFSMLPIKKTVLDFLKESGFAVIGIGKIGDIFAQSGITLENHTHTNAEGIQATIDAMNLLKSDGLIFTNLVDYDMLYGHRNDPVGYRNCLIEFDNALPSIINTVNEGELLILTADHGCDPTDVSTDHTREYTPLLVYSKGFKTGINLGIRKTFADIGQTIADYFGIKPLENGTSFLSEIK